MTRETAEKTAQASLTISTVRLAIPPAGIALFKAIIESYDNLATVRTDDPVRHHLKLYCAPESRDELDSLIAALTARFSIVRLAPA